MGLPHQFPCEFFMCLCHLMLGMLHVFLFPPSPLSIPISIKLNSGVRTCITLIAVMEDIL